MLSRGYRRGPNFGRHELARLILATLRTASEPIGIDEISQRVVTAKGLDPADKILRAEMCESIRSTLSRLRKQNTIEGISGGRGSKWKLAIKDLH